MLTLSDQQAFSLMIAAICHNLEHPGVNNQFLVNSKSSLATLYNHESILEKHHAFRAFELMLHPAIDLLAVFSKEEYDAFRQQVMSLILATDLASHNEYVASLQLLGDTVCTCMCMESLLKRADLSYICIYMYIYIHIYMYVCKFPGRAAHGRAAVYLFMFSILYVSTYLHIYISTYLHICKSAGRARHGSAAVHGKFAKVL